MYLIYRQKYWLNLNSIFFFFRLNVAGRKMYSRDYPRARRGFFDIDYFVLIDRQDHRKILIFVVIHRVIHLEEEEELLNLTSETNVWWTHRAIVVFEEDLRSKYSFVELLLKSIHNDVSFREEAKSQIELFHSSGFPTNLNILFEFDVLCPRKMSESFLK